MENNDNGPVLSPEDIEDLIGGIFDPKTQTTVPLPVNLLPPEEFIPVTLERSLAGLELTELSPKAFLSLVATFEEQTQRLGLLPPLNLPNGWYVVGQGLGEYLLRRNIPNGNRQAMVSRAQYYGRQMTAGGWKPTGEAIVLDLEGHLKNGQHRNWAALLGKTRYVTYIVSDAPVIENAFVFYDDVRARSAADALKTAQLNGVSALVARLVALEVNYQAGAYTCTTKRGAVKLTPGEVLAFVKSYPLCRKAARTVVADYDKACELVGDTALVAFIAFNIFSRYGEDTAIEFLDELNDPNEANRDGVKAIHAFLTKESKSQKPLGKHLVLAHLIKGFNAWIEHASVKTLKIHVDDDYPSFASVQPEEVVVE